MRHHRLGKASNKHLEQGSDAIKLWVPLTLKLSPVDFSVVDVGRLYEEQVEYFNNGDSWTLDSDHLIVIDEFTGELVVPSEAVDIYPWVNGRTDHNPYYYKQIAQAGFAAAAILGTPMWWGGFWKEIHQDYPHWATHRDFRG